MSTLSTAQVKQAACELFNADQSGRQIQILTLRHAAMDMDDAYAIQDALIAQHISGGRRQVGWKIGLTSKAMQAALNIDIPDSGVLLDNMVLEHGGTVPKNRFIQPRIEAEIAFVMKTDLSGENVDRAQILAATDYVTPALEILDTRIERQDSKTGTTRKVFDTIADNAANAGVVLGDKRHPPTSVDLRWVGTILSRDDVVEETGLGAGVLNDPVQSMVWLVQRLSQYGKSLRSGDIVLSGSFIRPAEAPPGSRFHADYGPFGEVRITFD